MDTIHRPFHCFVSLPAIACRFKHSSILTAPEKLKTSKYRKITCKSYSNSLRTINQLNSDLRLGKLNNQYLAKAAQSVFEKFHSKLILPTVGQGASQSPAGVQHELRRSSEAHNSVPRRWQMGGRGHQKCGHDSAGSGRVIYHGVVSHRDKTCSGPFLVAICRTHEVLQGKLFAQRTPWLCIAAPL